MILLKILDEKIFSGKDEIGVSYCGSNFTEICFYMCPINKNLAFLQIMAWRRAGDKQLSERKGTWYIGAYIHHSTAVGCQG